MTGNLPLGSPVRDIIRRRDEENILTIPSAAESFIVEAFDANARSARRKFELRGGDAVIQHHPGVFPCMPVSLAIAEALPLLTGLRVADVGTGTGILAIAASLAGAEEVMATDSSQEAVAVAQGNFTLNGCGKTCHAIHADILPADAGEFDLIVSNPPWMRVLSDLRLNISENILRAVDGGADGLAEMRRLFDLAPKFLKPNGRVIVPIPFWPDLKDGMGEMRSKGWQMTVLNEFVLPDWLPLVFGRSSASHAGCATVTVRIATVSFHMP